MRENEYTKILDWPGYRVYRYEIDEAAKTLRLWVPRKRGNRQLISSGCGRKVTEAHDFYEREVRDLPWRKYQTTDRKSTRLNSSHTVISYAVFCLKKKKKNN